MRVRAGAAVTGFVKIAAAVLIGLLVVFGVSWCYERSHGTTDAQLDTARAHTQAAEIIAAKAETVFVEKMVAATASRVVYRTVRDSVLLHLTDTVLVKETIARADTVIARDSSALSAAERTIAAEKGVTDSVRKELVLALRPRIAPRFSGSASGLYDVIDKTPAASLTGNLRIIGRVSLAIRADQRFVAGEAARGYVGVTVAY